MLVQVVEQTPVEDLHWVLVQDLGQQILAHYLEQELAEETQEVLV